MLAYLDSAQLAKDPVWEQVDGNVSRAALGLPEA